MTGLALLLACSSGPTVTPADPARVGLAAGLGVLKRAPMDPREGTPIPVKGYQVQPVSLQVYEGFRVSAALFSPQGAGPRPGVLVAHGLRLRLCLGV